MAPLHEDELPQVVHAAHQLGPLLGAEPQLAAGTGEDAAEAGAGHDRAAEAPVNLRGQHRRVGVGVQLLPPARGFRGQVEQELSVNNPWWTFSTRFNVAATQSVPAARMHDKESEGVMMRWGLVPSTTKGVVSFLSKERDW